MFLKLGADGVIVSDGTRRERIAAHRVKAIDATGAGDCFCGAALARLAAGDVEPLPRPEAVRSLLASPAR